MDYKCIHDLCITEYLSHRSGYIILLHKVTTDGNIFRLATVLNNAIMLKKMFCQVVGRTSVITVTMQHCSISTRVLSPKIQA